MGSVSVFESTRLALARLTVPGRDELERGLLQAAQASARAMHVQRVGIWFFSQDESAIVCAAMWDESASKGDRGQRLELAGIPSYAAALKSRRVILAHDACTAPETRELAASYLAPNDITSLLDAPIYHAGEVVGVACHEHVGERRAWTDRERDLASSLADVIALLLEQATRADTEVALRLQQERSAKLERQVALARLCSGVAHDFNNVLAAILLQLDLTQRRFDVPGLAESLSDAIASAEAGQRIVRQLLSYARAGESKPRAVHVNKEISGRRSLLTAAAGQHRLVLEVPDERFVVEIDPALLDQIVLNLVTNANEAMPQAGTIRVSLGGDRDWVAIAVHDQGVGIDEAIREHIFEPFFTTKGAGTGLGLSTVHAIVEKAHGRIEIESKKGEGSTITVRLPRIEG